MAAVIPWSQKEPWQMTLEEHDGMDWSQVETGVPATLNGWRGEGAGGALTPKWQERLGRKYLLGEGLYVAPSVRLAEPFGYVRPVRVRLYNPYVLSGANLAMIEALDLDAIKAAGHDGIVIKSGQAGFGPGQEDLRQLVVFPPFVKDQVRFEPHPVPGTIAPGTRVLIQPRGPISDYERQQIAPYLGKTGVVRSLVHGHPKVKIGSRTILFNKGSVTPLHGDHYRAVKQALQEGLPVPPEVLADYPDLAAEAGSRRGSGLMKIMREAWQEARWAVSAELSSTKVEENHSRTEFPRAKDYDRVLSVVLIGREYLIRHRDLGYLQEGENRFSENLKHAARYRTKEEAQAARARVRRLM